MQDRAGDLELYRTGYHELRSDLRAALPATYLAAADRFLVQHGLLLGAPVRRFPATGERDSSRSPSRDGAVESPHPK
jgi:hypothetical protein